MTDRRFLHRVWRQGFSVYLPVSGVQPRELLRLVQLFAEYIRIFLQKQLNLFTFVLVQINASALRISSSVCNYKKGIFLNT